MSKQTEQPSRLSTGREVETWVFIRGGGRGQVSVLSSVATIFSLGGEQEGNFLMLSSCFWGG